MHGTTVKRANLQTKLRLKSNLIAHAGNAVEALEGADLTYEE